MSEVRDPADHIHLFLPGPVETRPEILEAQSKWMIGHRMPECAELIGSVHPKLKRVFATESRVIISASSGTGLWEAATRNCVRERVLHGINGAFSSRWAEVSELNGKQVERIEVEWGKALKPEMFAEALADGGFDAVAFAHNETSAGVLSPLKEIAAAVRAAPGGEDIMILVDAVSGLSGTPLEFDAWDLDVALCSSQKAFALPPGLAFCAVSDRAMARAATVPNRGYYFDFITLDKYLQKNQTPATPAISLLYATDVQLDSMLEEGMDQRFARHLALRDRTVGWARSRGLALFSEPGYESPTVTCIDNTREIDINGLNAFLRARGMILSNGYGALKGKTFRIGHMGDCQLADLEKLLSAMDDYLLETGQFEVPATTPGMGA